MKKLLFCLSLAVVSGTLVSCRKDDDKPTVDNSTVFNQKNLIESGKWVLIKKVVISGDTGNTTTYIAGEKNGAGKFYDEYSKIWYDDTGFCNYQSWDKGKYEPNIDSQKYEIEGNKIKYLGFKSDTGKDYVEEEVVKFIKGEEMVLKRVDIDDDELPGNKPDEVYRTYQHSSAQ